MYITELARNVFGEQRARWWAWRQARAIRASRRRAVAMRVEEIKEREKLLPRPSRLTNVDIYEHWQTMSRDATILFLIIVCLAVAVIYAVGG